MPRNIIDPRAFRPYLWIVSANRGLPRSVGISSYPGYSLFIFSEAKRLRRFNWRAFRLGREGGGNIWWIGAFWRFSSLSCPSYTIPYGRFLLLLFSRPWPMFHRRYVVPFGRWTWWPCGFCTPASRWFLRKIDEIVTKYFHFPRTRSENHPRKWVAI